MLRSLNSSDHLHEPSKVYTSLIHASSKTSLPEALIRAVITTESSWNAFAFNAEPRWRWMWDVHRGRNFRPLTKFERESEEPPEDFPCLAGDNDQEWWLQQCSIGWMQTMGAVVREMGSKEPYLTFLTNPASSLYYGCTYLANLKARHFKVYGWAGVLRAYNTGSPEDSTMGRLYLTKVERNGFKV